MELPFSSQMTPHWAQWTMSYDNEGNGSCLATKLPITAGRPLSRANWTWLPVASYAATQTVIIFSDAKWAAKLPNPQLMSSMVRTCNKVINIEQPYLLSNKDIKIRNENQIETLVHTKPFSPKTSFVKHYDPQRSRTCEWG